jgi:hypothetical protein
VFVAVGVAVGVLVGVAVRVAVAVGVGLGNWHTATGVAVPPTESSSGGQMGSVTVAVGVLVGNVRSWKIIPRTNESSQIEALVVSHPA